MSDYIKREDALKAVDAFIGTDPIADRIKLIPSADVVPVRHGRWIESTMDLICSSCETMFNDELAYMCRDYTYGNPRYCPYCGAKMDGEDE